MVPRNEKQFSVLHAMLYASKFALFDSLNIIFVNIK